MLIGAYSWLRWAEMAMHLKDVTPYTWQTRKQTYAGTCLAVVVECGGRDGAEM
jgi:ABC-type phosphate/phosphonate transport system permease subunit